MLDLDARRISEQKHSGSQRSTNLLHDNKDTDNSELTYPYCRKTWCENYFTIYMGEHVTFSWQFKSSIVNSLCVIRKKIVIFLTIIEIYYQFCRHLRSCAPANSVINHQIWQKLCLICVSNMIFFIRIAPKYHRTYRDIPKIIPKCVTYECIFWYISLVGCKDSTCL